MTHQTGIINARRDDICILISLDYYNDRKDVNYHARNCNPKLIIDFIIIVQVVRPPPSSVQSHLCLPCRCYLAQEPGCNWVLRSYSSIDHRSRDMISERNVCALAENFLITKFYCIHIFVALSWWKMKLLLLLTISPFCLMMVISVCVC